MILGKSKKKQKKTIAAAYKAMYSGCPGDNDAAMSDSQRMPPSPELNQDDNVAGKRMMLEAKIGGMTPDMLSFNGR